VYDGAAARPTVEQLLTNTSGMSGAADAAAADRYDNTDGALERAARILSDVELFAAPGQEYEYVSANYLLLGAIIEEVTGREFDEHLRATVLDPLDMDSVITDTEAAKRLPPGHRQYLGQAVSYTDPYDESGVSYGYMAGSAADLGRFMLAQLGDGEAGGERILSAETVAESHKGRVKTSNEEFGYGWSVGTLAGTGERMVWKAGATSGYHTMLVLLPERDRAIVLTQNTYSEARALQLRNAAFDAARLSIGESTGPALTPDPTLSYAPWILAALCLPLLLSLWTTWRRARRGTLSRSRLRFTGWALLGAGVPAALLLALPAWFEVSLLRLQLWAPDLGLCLIALSVAAFVAAGWRIGLGMRR
ncbi:MAG: serine hydrolase domain-containing protein, partial [Stackebrandtia sp.]